MSEAPESVAGGRGRPENPQMNSTLLNARDLGKTYFLGKRPLEVLRQVNLAVGHGDFQAVRGASGAGKSTLLHLLGGLDLPSTGTVCFDGRNLALMSGAELSRFRNRKVGFVFQAYHLLPELSALENVCLPALMARVQPARAERLGRELLRSVGGDRPRSGQRARPGFGRRTDRQPGFPQQRGNHGPALRPPRRVGGNPDHCDARCPGGLPRPAGDRTRGRPGQGGREVAEWDGVMPVAQVERSSKLKVQSSRKVPNYKLQCRPAPLLHSRLEGCLTDVTARCNGELWTGAWYFAAFLEL